MKKCILILTICMLIVSSTLYIDLQEVEASSGSIAIDAWARMQAGMMAIAGVVLAGTTSILDAGYNLQDVDLVAEAERIWNQMDENVKVDWDVITGVNWASEAIGIQDTPVYTSILDAASAAYYNLQSLETTTRAEATRILAGSSTGSLEFTFDSGYYFVAMNATQTSYRVFRTLNLSLGGLGTTRSLGARMNDVVMQQNSSDGIYSDMTLTLQEWEILRETGFQTTATAINYLNRGLQNTTNINRGMVVGVVSIDAWNNWILMKENIYQTGIPLLNLGAIPYPLSSVRPYVWENDLRVPLEWNPAFDGWALPSNPSVPYTGELVWNIPQPRWYTDTNGQMRVGFPTLSGNWLDALTGQSVNPPRDGVENPPGTGAPSGFWDAVTSGLSSIINFIRDILNAILQILGLLTTGLIGNVADIQWDKLRQTGSIFTTKFPFSIPWDVGRAFDSIFGGFDVSTPPSWDYVVMGNSFTITIPEFFLGWFPIIRGLLLVLFDIGIIYAIRQWLGGAS